MLVDTHCHLDSHYFPDADEVLARARAAGVGRFLVVGVGRDLAAARAAAALAARRDDVAAAVGVHPHDAKSLVRVGAWDEAMLAELAELARRPEVVAVGEIGLDYHYDNSPRDVQRRVFARLVGLAREVKKPIVVHTREAAADTLDVLEAEGARDVGGVFHCMSEDWAFAERGLALGFDLSFSGILTFNTTVAVHDVARRAPRDRIHVETDSPYLIPEPVRRQKRGPGPGRTRQCEPAYIVHTARRLAELRGENAGDLEPALLENAVRRFRLARWR